MRRLGSRRQPERLAARGLIGLATLGAMVALAVGLIASLFRAVLADRLRVGALPHVGA